MTRGWVVLASLFVFLLVAYPCQPTAFCEENALIDLPRDEVQEYRALDAEARALKAETLLAIQEIEVKRREILSKWQTLVGGGLEGWQLDLKEGKLRKEEKQK